MKPIDAMRGAYETLLKNARCGCGVHGQPDVVHSDVCFIREARAQADKCEPPQAEYDRVPLSQVNSARATLDRWLHACERRRPDLEQGEQMRLTFRCGFQGGYCCITVEDRNEAVL